MILRRIRHKGICDHPQTPYARRKCRAAKIAAILAEQEGTNMGDIKVVTVENRRRDWRGREIVTAEQYTQITGTVTAVAIADRMPVYTITAGGTTVTVANPHGVAADMRGVAVDARVRILASGKATIADYVASTVERI